VSYRVVFGFQMPELDWPGAVPPIDCPPEAYIISGIQHVSFRVAFGFDIQVPEWSGRKSHMPCGVQYCSHRVVFVFQMPELEWPRAIPPIDWHPRLILLMGSNKFRTGSPSDWRCKSLSGQGGNPGFGVGSNMFRMGSFSDSRRQSFSGQAQFTR
jgi:hypothetical protein